MLEEQQGTNYRLTDQLAAKEEQILQLKQALDLRKADRQGETGPCNQPCVVSCAEAEQGYKHKGSFGSNEHLQTL